MTHDGHVSGRRICHPRSRSRVNSYPIAGRWLPRSNEDEGVIITVVPKLRRSFRIGVSRGVGLSFKPIVSVHIINDGGVIVMPRDLRGYRWRYGLVKADGEPDGKQFETHLRPKLHYHRSGIARITLSGHLNELQLCEARFGGIPSLTRSQIFSIIATRLWEFPSIPVRKGDLVLFEKRWPWTAGISLSLIRLDPNQSFTSLIPGLEPFGLIQFNPEMFCIDLGGYGQRALLFGRTGCSHEFNSETAPSSSIVATGREEDLDGPRYVGLWSGSVRIPSLAFEDDRAMPSSYNLVTLRDGSVPRWTSDELAAEIFG